MRVAFGATALQTPLTGIGQYALHLASGLQQRRDVDLICFYGRRFAREIVDRPAPVVSGRMRVAIRKYVPAAYTLRRMFEQARFSAGARRQGFDVYHEPNYLALSFDGPTVITVHDLSWIRFPETHPAERVRAMERYFAPALERAAIVLTDSEFVKREVLEVFGGDADRIVPVSLGLDPEFRPMLAQETQSALQPLGLLHGGYFLSVGTLEPRKNLHATIAAYGQLPHAVRARHPLVLAGMKGWRTSSLDRLLEPLVASGEARVLGYLERSELAQVTAGALALVYPSLYEGFGLPPLEAMGCAVPPVVSTAGSLLEVVGDCGLSVEPQDVDGLAAAMLRLAEHPEERAQLAQRALQRAAGFTWSRCVDETVVAYRRASASSR